MISVQCIDGTIITIPKRYLDSSLLFLENECISDSGTDPSKWDCDYDDVSSLISYFGVCCPHYLDNEEEEIADIISFNASLFLHYMVAEYLEDEVMMENIAVTLLDKLTDRYFADFDKSDLNINTSIDIIFSKLDGETQKFVECIPEKYKKYTDRILAYPDRESIQDYFEGNCSLYDTFNIAEYLFDRSVMRNSLDLIKDRISRKCNINKIMGKLGNKVYGGMFDISNIKILDETGEIDFNEINKIPMLARQFELIKDTTSKEDVDKYKNVLNTFTVPSTFALMRFNEKVKEHNILEPGFINLVPSEKYDELIEELYKRTDDMQQTYADVGFYKSMLDFIAQEK